MSEISLRSPLSALQAEHRAVYPHQAKPVQGVLSIFVRDTHKGERSIGALKQYRLLNVHQSVHVGISTRTRREDTGVMSLLRKMS
jgi:hypothetical protein